MKLVKSLLLLGFISFVVVNCGKNGEAEDLTGKNFPALAFPETGIVDAATIPAGTYKAQSVKTYLLGTAEDKTIKARFEHTFDAVGAPKEGDKIERKTDFAGFNKPDQRLNLSISINLPLRLEATGSAISFHTKHEYSQRSSSDKSWRWTISEKESAGGVAFHDLFKPAQKQPGRAIYGTDAIRGTAKVAGNTVTLVYETKVSKNGKLESHRIVEVTYVK